MTATKTGPRRRARETPAALKARARKIVARLERAYPEATCALHHASALELLVATILSAQSTDARVNMVTPALFAKYLDAGKDAREDRAGSDAARAARQVDLVLAHAHSARAARLHRPAAEMRGVRGESVMPVVTRMNRASPDARTLCSRTAASRVLTT